MWIKNDLDIVSLVRNDDLGGVCVEDTLCRRLKD